MNEFELFGCIIWVNIVKLMKIKEGYSCVVWSEDSWLSKYVGQILEDVDMKNVDEKVKEISEEGMVKKRGNLRVFFDVIIGGCQVGRIIIELRYDVVFMIVENFCFFCIYEKGFGYCGSIFYCVIL